MTKRKSQKRLKTRKRSQGSDVTLKKLNRQAWVVTIFFTLLFLGMIGYYIYFIAVDSQEIASNTYNKRLDGMAENVIRGTIYSKDGEMLAYTDTNGTERNLKDDSRIYPYGRRFAHVVGITTHGGSGLEKQSNYDLLSVEATPIQKIIDDFQETQEHGCDVHTTLDTDLQSYCYRALGDSKGAVFMMNPKTGAVSVMTSRPSYNPETIDRIWKKLAKSKTDSRLINRATQGKYTPGSTFKISTALEYIKETKESKDFSYYCDGYIRFKIPKDERTKYDKKSFTMHCFDGTAHGQENLEQAFANSCNCAFSEIGTKLDISKFQSTNNTLMFNQKLPIDIESSRSKFVLNDESKKSEIVQTSIGQGNTTVSPAHMGMIAAAISNKGVLMKPYLVDSVVNSHGVVVKNAKQKEYRRLMSEDDAKVLKKYMKAVCEWGTGRTMNYQNYVAYGKTGTAELDNNDHINSWFVGWAKRGKKKVVIAICLENIVQGSKSATFIAKDIFDYYFDQ